MDFDVIVIGSGFGGAFTSCRLAEKGKMVLVLERGKKWDRTTYPRELEDEWIWSHVDPKRSEEHTSELQSQSNLVCRLLLEKKKKNNWKIVIYINYKTSMCARSPHT